MAPPKKIINEAVLCELFKHGLNNTEISRRTGLAWPLIQRHRKSMGFLVSTRGRTPKDQFLVIPVTAEQLQQAHENSATEGFSSMAAWARHHMRLQ